jgi:hypothetical protein
MRSTRATAAVARLNRRSEGRSYQMVLTGAGLFKLCEQVEGGVPSAPMSLDDFVRYVDAQGPQAVRRVTKNDEAFAKQLIKKPQP